MSLNNINLPSTLLVDLYANVLVECDAMNMPEPPKAVYLGKAQKGILIVVANQDAPFLSDTERAFLTSVLTACQLSIADTAIVNFSRDKKSYAEWGSFLNINTTLLFGVSPIDFGLPINFPDFQVQEFSKSTYIAAPSLLSLEKDKELKKSLWVSLKKHFGL